MKPRLTVIAGRPAHDGIGREVHYTAPMAPAWIWPWAYVVAMGVVFIGVAYVATVFLFSLGVAK